MEQEIKNLIEKNYKHTTVESIQVHDNLHGDFVVMKCYGRNDVHPFIALRILNKYPKIYAVLFTDGWFEGHYDRETLKLGGYKVKEHKK